MNEFLPQLKSPIRHKVTDTTEQKDIFFRISFNNKGAYVDVVDTKMKKVQVDYQTYGGDVFVVLRSLAMIEEKRQMQLSWEGDEPRIYLGENAYLLYQLIRCKNLLNEWGEAITVSSSAAMPTLEIVEKDNKLTTDFFLNTDKEKVNKFQFLSDSFVLANRMIYMIEPVGDNYSELSSFRTNFSKDMLETFLSVFYTYFDNMDTKYDEYKIERSSLAIRTTPMLVFEKVDFDKTLFMHLENSLPDFDTQAFVRFHPTWQAKLTEEGNIVLKRVIHEPLENMAANLKKTILSYAPDKEAKKDIFRDGTLFVIPPETAVPFLSKELPALKNEFVLAGTDHLNEYNCLN